MKLTYFQLTALILLLSHSAFSAEKGGSRAAGKAGEAYVHLPTAKKGGIFYGELVSNLKSLNPITKQDLQEEETLHYIFSRLMEKDFDTGEYFPLLAEKLEVSKDHKVMTYTLRKEAVWDDGTPITTDDVEFTYQKLMDQKVDAAPLRAYFGPFQFEKVDQRTFRLIVENPNVNTVMNFNDDFKIIQKKQWSY